MIIYFHALFEYRSDEENDKIIVINYGLALHNSLNQCIFFGFSPSSVLEIQIISI